MNRLWGCLLLLVVVPAARGENWPAWRGPTLDGICRETGIPSKWSETENLLWKLPMPGTGGSTPIVWEKSIFLTCQDDASLVLLCIGVDGKEKWRRKVGSGNRKVRGDEGNEASNSPSTDGKYVYAAVGSGDIACFDFDGKEIWKFNFQERYGKFRYQFGCHTTPLLVDDRLYMQLIHSKEAPVVAIDKATGKEVWKIVRPSDGRAECEHSYASMALWTDGNKRMLITHGNDYTVGHDMQTGEEIWRVGGLNPKEKYNPTLRFVATPVATADLIVIPSAKNGPVVGLSPAAMGMVMPGSSHEIWRKTSGTPDVSSPLVHDGLVYLCRENGVLICLEAKTGKELYNQRLHSARYRASPLYVDGKVYCTARDGTVTVVKAGPKFEVISVNKLPDQIAASPVVSNGKLYLRGFDALYAFAEAK